MINLVAREAGTKIDFTGDILVDISVCLGIDRALFDSSKETFCSLMVKTADIADFDSLSEFQKSRSFDRTAPSTFRPKLVLYF